MNCKEACEWIPLVASGDGTEEIALQLEAHVSTCSKCSEKYAKAKKMIPVVETHSEDYFRSHEIISSVNRRQQRSIKLLVILGTAAAVILLICLAVFMPSGPESYNLGPVQVFRGSEITQIDKEKFKLDAGKIVVTLNPKEKIFLDTDAGSVQFVCEDSDGPAVIQVSIEEKGGTAMKKLKNTFILVLSGTISMFNISAINENKTLIHKGHSVHIFQDKNTQIEKFLKDLSSNDPDVRLAAMSSLIELEVEKELTAFKSDDHEAITRAQLAIGTIDLLKNLPSLKKYWKENPSEIEGLVGANANTLIIFINDKLKKNPDELDQAVIKALAREILKDKEIVDKIRGTSFGTRIDYDWYWLYIEALDHNDQNVRRLAAWALSLTVHKPEIKLSRQMIRQIIEKLKHSDRNVSTYASYSLMYMVDNGKIEGANLKELVQELLKNIVSKNGESASDYLLSNIANKLGEKLADELAVFLIKNLDQKNDEMRTYIFSSLRNVIGKVDKKIAEKVANILLEKVNSKNVKDRAAVMRTLGSVCCAVKGELSKKILLAILESIQEGTEEVLNAAASSFGIVALQFPKSEIVQKGIIELFKKLADKKASYSVDQVLRPISWSLEGELLKKAIEIVEKLDKKTVGYDFFIQVLKYKDKDTVEGMLSDKKAWIKAKFVGGVEEVVIITDDNEIAEKLSSLVGKKVKLKGKIQDVGCRHPEEVKHGANYHIAFVVTGIIEK